MSDSHHNEESSNSADVCGNCLLARESVGLHGLDEGLPSQEGRTPAIPTAFSAQNDAPVSQTSD